MMSPHITDQPKRLHQQRLHQRGAIAAAEFAMIAPFLVVCLLGMAELGRAIMVRQVLNDAARKACRNAVLPNRTNANATADANDILTDNNIDSTKATVTILVNGQSVDVSTAARDDKISVKVSIPFSNVSWTSPIFLTGTAVESETLVMAREG